jgi:outer membrane protein assembly factor BamB
MDMHDGRASRRRFVAALAGVSAVGLSGCGSNGSGTDTPEEDEDDETPMPTATTTASSVGKGTTAAPTDTATAEPTDTATAEPTDTPEPTETPTDTATATPSAGALAEWPTYMYNNQNWGEHPEATGPSGSPSATWTRDLNGAHVNATPVLANGTIYVGDGRPNDDTGRLYALDPFTGETQWDLELPGPILGGAVVDDQGRVFISAGQAFRALEGDGTEVWSFEINSDLDYAAPTVTEDALYIGTDGGTIYKIDKLTSTVQWTYATSGEIPSAPVVHDGRVYAPSRVGTVTAIDAESGESIWVVDQPLGQVNGLSMRDDRLYAADENDQVVGLDTQGNTRMYGALDSAAGGTPAVADGLVFAPTRGGDLVALDQGDGIEQWSFGASDPFTAPPVVADGTVYAGCHDNNVYAIDAESGDEEWSFATDNNIVDPAPIVSGGTVYIGSRDGNFYAIGD